MTKSSATGKVSKYERSTARASVEVGRKSVEFSTTCFYGSRGQDHPSVGDSVRVVFADGDKASVLAVIAEP